MTSPKQDAINEGTPNPEPIVDLLAESASRAGLDADAIDRVADWLAKQLEDDRFAQLERAGHAIEDRIPLARVFVDLEFAETPVGVADNTDIPGELFLRSLNDPQEDEDDDPFRETTPWVIDDRVRGYVLIGGPGQGKSTLGQLLCQLHRAWLLRPRLDKMDPEQRGAVEAFSDERAARDLGKPAEHRFPIRIALSDAAAWLAMRNDASPSEEEPELFRYLIERAKCPLPPAELLRLLSEIDWMLVLDGLDEVPAPSNRDRLLEAARRLIDRLMRSPRRGLLLATTRPQGYAGEFDRMGMCLSRRYLVPFSKERAREYAKRLVDARFAANRQEIVLQRLEQAAAVDTTARLMQTPLQVTILATLVDQIGRAPSEQWTLFREYYRVIYAREMERPFEAADLLRLYRAHVDKIHTHVGLLLQVEAEQSGGTGSVLSPERFGWVVDAILAGDEIAADRRRELVEKLGRAVRERLVLLVELEPDRLGFEIRSIQEFMAAWALSQKDAEVEARAAQIAPAQSFRNVVLFLASKAFTELSDLRDAFADRICPNLNELPNDPLAQASLVGSVLALEILEEGSGLKQTKYVRKLVSLGARLLELPPREVHKRLAKACLADEDARLAAMPILEKALRERLMLSIPEQRLGAWAVLLSLLDAGEAWARELAEAHWEDDARLLGGIPEIAFLRGFTAGRWLAEKFLNSPNKITPDRLLRLARGIPFESATVSNARIRALRHLSYQAMISIDVPDTPLLLNLVQFSTSEDVPWGALAEMPDPSSGWLPWVASARFVLRPSANTLSEELTKLANVFDAITDQRRVIARQIPWPLGACLGVVSTADELRALAQRASAGELGNSDDWRDAETRWRQRSTIDLSEVISAPGSEWPYSGNLRDGGVPLSAVLEIWTPEDTTACFNTLRIGFNKTVSPIMRSILSRWIVTYLSQMGNEATIVDAPLSTAELREIVSALRGPFPLYALRALEPWKHPGEEWADLLDKIGRRGWLVVFGQDFKKLYQYLSDLFAAEPHRTGILNILRSLAVNDELTEVPRELLVPLREGDEIARHSAQVILLAQGALSLDEATDFVASLSLSERRDLSRAYDVIQILDNMPEDSPMREVLLPILWRNTPAHESWFATRLLDAMNLSLRQRKSGLDDPLVWDRLHLPLPRPERLQPAEPPPSAERRPVRIESIHLENIRGFSEIRLTPAPSADDNGQWLVLLGENGLGKSTILRSLVFALVDLKSQPNRLPRSTFDAPWRHLGMKDQDPARIQVTVHGKSYSAAVETDPNAAGDDERLSQNPPFLSYPVFAYGCRRGSALGGASRRIDDEPGAEVPTLFDEGADLIHAETWLLLRENAALKEKEQQGPAWKLYQDILSVLRDILLGVNKIEARNGKIWVSGPEVGEVPLAALSDGYLTTIGWVIDLIARWIRRAELRKETIPSEFTKTMTGLVLIDEIDLHLHPEWQRRVISDVQRILPRMSFVATTHNPVTLVGVKAEEIWRLKREDGRIVARQGTEEPALMTGSDIYDAYFGIRSLFPHELGEMLDRYGFLARNPVRTDDEDATMRELLTKLRERGLDPSWQPVPRDPLSTDAGDEPA